MFSLGSTYAWSKRITFRATFDFVNARNAFNSLAPWPDLHTFSDVKLDTTRFLGGFDFELTSNATCYLRYQLFDYDDEAAFFDGGRSEMILLGGSAVF